MQKISRPSTVLYCDWSRLILRRRSLAKILIRSADISTGRIWIFQPRGKIRTTTLLCSDKQPPSEEFIKFCPRSSLLLLGVSKFRFPLIWSIRHFGWLGSSSVRSYNPEKGRKVTLPCSYRGTCSPLGWKELSSKVLMMNVNHSAKLLLNEGGEKSLAEWIRWKSPPLPQNPPLPPFPLPPNPYLPLA